MQIHNLQKVCTTQQTSSERQRSDAQWQNFEGGAACLELQKKNFVVLISFFFVLHMSQFT